MFSSTAAGIPAAAQSHMNPDAPESTADRLDLSDLVGELTPELRCLLGPSIELATGGMPSGGAGVVRARRDQIVDLLRHLALDAHDAMPDGGTVTIRTGCLDATPNCAAIVIHEVPASPEGFPGGRHGRIRKGRSLGLGASYDTVERAGGHFHVSCRGRETVLTICFPVAK